MFSLGIKKIHVHYGNRWLSLPVPSFARAGLPNPRFSHQVVQEGTLAAHAPRPWLWSVQLWFFNGLQPWSTPRLPSTWARLVTLLLFNGWFFSFAFYIENLVLNGFRFSLILTILIPCFIVRVRLCTNIPQNCVISCL